MGKFTAEEIQIAKAVDLVDLAEQIGIPLKRKGRFYQAVGMDSVMIFNRSSWCRFSQGVGGSTIDFLEYFRNMDFVEAVKYLLEFAGYIRTETMQKFQPERQIGKIEETKQKKDIQKEPFVLPSKSETSRRLYGYLIKQRKLSKQMIDFWVKKGILYESGTYHNLVFVGKDPEGIPRFASQRGTMDKYGKPFKGDVTGNDKTYGVNLVDRNSDTIYVYEAAIDAIPCLGNVNEGFDKEKIKKLYVEDFIEEAKEYCKECWAVNLCTLCYVNCYDANGLHLSYRHNSCRNERKYLEDNLRRYHALMEANPSELEQYNEMEIH